MSNDRVKDALRILAADRPFAHRLIFKARHKSATPQYHESIQDAFFDKRIRNLLFWVFRGGAKSSIAEEALALGAIHKQFNNCLIVGANESRASERLIAVRHELQYNETISELYGDQVGKTWSDTSIILSNNIKIQCIGQEQDLRGVKYLSHRPDFVLFDDLERREDVRTPQARAKVKHWLFGELIPALDPDALIRMNATPLDAEALSVQLNRLPNWRTMTVPIKFINDVGQWEATWPDRYPLEWINEKEKEYADAGELDMFQREYMLQVINEEAKSFKKEYFYYQHYPRSFEAVYAVYDPARTIKATSAHTGYAVYSWNANKLVVWESGGQFWQPSDITEHIFHVNEKYNPVYIAVEKDGLEEFLLQPLRQEAVRRSTFLPLRDVRAPKGKIDFIRGLEPFFKAKEVILVGEAEDHLILTSQLENFPTGRIDVPNALAYAMRLRPGMPVYEDFTNEHVIPDLDIAPNEQLYVAVHATPTALAAALCQWVRGALRVHLDFCAEGDPGLTLAPAVQSFSLMAGGRPLRLIAPRSHFTAYDAVGLRQAARALPASISQGGDIHRGRNALRAMLRTRLRGAPAIQVSADARLTLRALAGGYAYPLNKKGEAAEPEQNVYALLMFALEALTGSALSSQNLPSDENDLGWAVAPDGRRYRSAKA